MKNQKFNNNANNNLNKKYWNYKNSNKYKKIVILFCKKKIQFLIKIKT